MADRVDNELKNQDPRKSGVSGLSGLKGINTKPKEESLPDLPYKRGMGRAAMGAGQDLFGPIEYVGTPELGTSKYDKDIQVLSQIEDLQNYRAEAQSNFASIANGILKGGILTATTFADNFIGTIMGALNVPIQAMTGNIDSFRDIGNAFIDNPFSRFMNDINKKSEEWLPNYYSEKEMSDPWYKQMFSANFIGDHFLKNIGFFAGAALSGKVSAGLMSKALGMKKYRDVFKGSVVNAAGETLNTGTDVYKAYKTGDAYIDGIKLTEDLAQSAKKLKNAEQTIKWTGAIAGAMGESRIEAIGNSDDYFEPRKQQLDLDYNNSLKLLEEEVASSNPELVNYIPEYDSEGNVIKWNRELNEIGKQIFEERKKDLDNEYNENLKELTKRKIDYANANFLMDLALLSYNDAIQFGKYMIGGYSTIKGESRNLVKATLDGANKKNIAPIVKKYLEGAWVPFSEGLEESGQKIISKGLETYQGSKYSQFYNSKVNPEVVEESIGFIKSFVDAFSDVTTDPKEWEDFYLGFITSLIGIPASSKTTTKEGKTKRTFQLQGGLWDSFREAREMNKEATALTDLLNKNSKDPKFQKMLENYIRQNSSKNRTEESLQENDVFTYKNLESKDFISAVLAYDNAGRSQDLLDQLEEFNTVTPENIDDYRSFAIPKLDEDGNPITNEDGTIKTEESDEHLIERLNKQKEEGIANAKNYMEIARNLRILYGNTASNDFIEELTYLTASAQDREKRISQIISEVQKIFSDKAEEIKKVYGVDIDTALNTIKDFQVAFDDEGLLDYINSVINNESIKSVEERTALIDAAIREKHSLRGKKGAITRKLNALERKDTKDITQEDIDYLDQADKEKQELDASIFSTLFTIELLKRELEENRKKFPSELMTKDFVAKLNDIIPLLAEREAMLDTYKKISEDPTLFEESAFENTKKAIDYTINRRAEKTFEELKSIGTFQEVRTKLSVLNPDEFNKLEELINNSEDFEVKKIFNDYKKVNELARIYGEFFVESDINNPTIQKAMVKILEKFNEADSYEDALKKLDDMYKSIAENDEIEDDVKEVYADIKKSIEDSIKAKEAIKKKEAKKKENKKKSGKRFLDIGEEGGDEDPQKEDNEKDDSDLPEYNIPLAKLSMNDWKRLITKYNLEEYLKLDIEQYDPEDLAEVLEPYLPEDIREANRNLTEAEGPAAPTEEFKDFDTDDEDIEREVLIEDGLVEEVKEGEGKEGNTKKEKPVIEKNSGKTQLHKVTILGAQERGSVVPSKDKDGNSDTPQIINRGNEDAFAVGRLSSQFVIDDLKDIKQRKATKSKDMWTIRLLEETGAYDFIDSGKLAKLQEEHGGQLPISFVLVRKSPKVPYEEWQELNSGEKREERIKKWYRDNYTLFAAVQTKEGTSTFYNNASKPQKMQLLGVVSAPEALKDELSELKKAVIDSVRHIKTADGIPHTYVMSNINTQLEYIFSGRLVKKNDEFSTIKQRPLKQILKEGDRENMQVVVIKGSETLAYGKNLKGTEIPINVNRPNSNDRIGTIWLKTKEADGRIYHKSLRMARFNADYVKNNEGNKDAITNNLRNIIKDLLRGTSDKTNIKKNILRIKMYLHIPEFVRADKNSFRIQGKPDIVKFTGDLETDVEEIINYIAKYNYRFSIYPSATLDKIIDSNIVTTDLASIHNANASFLISRVAKESDGIWYPISSEDVKNFKIHTGQKGFQFGRDYHIISLAETKEDGTKGSINYYYNMDENNNIYFYEDVKKSNGETSKRKLDPNKGRDALKIELLIWKGEIDGKAGFGNRLTTTKYLPAKSKNVVNKETGKKEKVVIRHRTPIFYRTINGIQYAMTPDGRLLTNDEIAEIHDNISKSIKSKSTLDEAVDEKKNSGRRVFKGRTSEEKKDEVKPSEKPSEKPEIPPTKPSVPSKPRKGRRGIAPGRQVFRGTVQHGTQNANPVENAKSIVEGFNKLGILNDIMTILKNNGVEMLPFLNDEDYFKKLDIAIQSQIIEYINNNDIESIKDIIYNNIMCWQ